MIPLTTKIIVVFVVGVVGVVGVVFVVKPQPTQSVTVNSTTNKHHWWLRSNHNQKINITNYNTLGINANNINLKKQF